jgi:hypothetical protein
LWALPSQALRGLYQVHQGRVRVLLLLLLLLLVLTWRPIRPFVKIQGDVLMAVLVEWRKKSTRCFYIYEKTNDYVSEFN